MAVLRGGHSHFRPRACRISRGDSAFDLLPQYSAPSQEMPLLPNERTRFPSDHIIPSLIQSVRTNLTIALPIIPYQVTWFDNGTMMAHTMATVPLSLGQIASPRLCSSLRNQMPKPFLILARPPFILRSHHTGNVRNRSPPTIKSWLKTPYRPSTRSPTHHSCQTARATNLDSHSSLRLGRLPNEQVHFLLPKQSGAARL